MSASELDNLHLADLHRLAAEHGVGGYRMLRRRELIRALQETDTDEIAIVVEGGRGPARESEPETERPRERERERDAERPRERERDTEAEPASQTERRGRARERGRERGRERQRERERGRGGRGRGDDEPAAAEEDEVAEDETTEDVSGVLEVTRQRYGFLRLGGLSAGDDDVYISAAQVRRCELRPGDEVAGPARGPRRGERHRALVHVDSVNGGEPSTDDGRPEFESLEAELAERRIPLTAEADVLTRAVDLLAPLAFGQRILVRAAPRSGRTTLLRGIAGAAAAAGARAIVLLVDERPEEASAWRRALPEAEFAIATADQAKAEQFRTAELALERARRLAESGNDVVLACDSLSRLAFAAGDVDEVKRLFGSGRELGGDGSLTVIATTLEGGHDDGEAERAVITTESSLVTLDPDLAADGVHPAIDAAECRVSNEDALRDPAELEAARRLRSLVADLDPREAADLLRERIEGSPSNAELLAGI